MATDKYYSTNSGQGPWDYIIIGSGMGGMVSAAILNQIGKRVLVLEQHYVPGGFTHTFKRKKWVWDVGVHAVGEVTEQALVGRLLNSLTGGELQWTSLGPVYEQFHFPDDFRIDFPDHHEAFRQTLYQAFPNERRAIDDYFFKVREVSGAMRGYFLSRALPRWLGAVASPVLSRSAQRAFQCRTEQVVSGLTSDERLRTVLTAQWGYYGSPPARASFAVQALVAKHFWHGAYYPIGGSARIAECLLRPVVAGGGAVRIKAEVEQLLLRRGQVVGVRLKGGEEIHGRKVVSAIGALETARRLLPKDASEARWTRDLKSLRPSTAHLCLYLGFKGDIRTAGAGAANKWVFKTWQRDFNNWRTDDPRGAPILYASFPSLKDPTHDPGPAQLHTGEVVTFLPWDTFRPWHGKQWQKRGDDYTALKAEMQERLLEQFLQHMPELKPMLEYVEMSTPVSTTHFTQAEEGAIYGIEPTPERFANPWLRPKSPLKNLYLSGGDIGLVGVVGALIGGVLAAVAAEPRGTFKLLREIAPRPPAAVVG